MTQKVICMALSSLHFPVPFADHLETLTHSHSDDALLLRQ
jgi:hypothetical protein